MRTSRTTVSGISLLVRKGQVAHDVQVMVEGKLSYKVIVQDKVKGLARLGQDNGLRYRLNPCQIVSKIGIPCMGWD